ncbi:hypothetical protein KRX52_19620 [Pseudomonas sp. MAP12]|uniref:Uncharacterized protein n=1 Tax=Geopseudomonas aromaticivorans TaxID=2849492 RepID=A0ABS6N1S1_9GAMM|nr:hypothetical protein [Pseudomonas aromaticivorans]MBV2134984.1 hypothetical protein [Pseudomonas aromaticivorans]
MENIQRPERHRKKLLLGLKIKQVQIRGPGIGTVSDGQEIGRILEKLGLSWDFQEWGRSAGASEKLMEVPAYPN